MSSSNCSVIVTSTFTKDATRDYRFQLAVQMCQAAKAAGYPVIVVDESLDGRARSFLSDVGATARTAIESGMGPARRQCIQAGIENGDIICWIEPEKVGMVSVLAPCVDMVARDGYDIVVPWRTRLFADYPPYQALSEARANQEMAELTGLNLDLMCGPRIMSRRGAECLMSYQGRSRVSADVAYDDNWGVLFVPILWALQDGLRVGSCPVEYVHPAVQTALEGRNPEMDRKRDIQRTALVAAMRQESRLIGLEPAA